MDSAKATLFRNLAPPTGAEEQVSKAGHAARALRRSPDIRRPLVLGSRAEACVSTRRCGGRGEPLVLLHPFGLCPEVWAPILPTLKQHHEVFALAIPGHRGSDPLPPGYEHTIERAVDLLEVKLDALGLSRAHLVGNSLGGWLAVELARRHRALSVIALAPGGGWELGSRQQKRLWRRLRLTRTLLQFGGPLATQLTRWALFRAALLRDAVAFPERLTPAQARFLVEGPWRCDVYDGVVKALPKQPPSPPFARLPCPIRLVWGEKDRLLPLDGYSERWRRVLPGADWVVLRNVGHIQMYDDPRAVARAILEFTEAASSEQRLAS